MSDDGRMVRLRLSSDRKKALAQYDELRRLGRTEGAVILCPMKDGSFQVLGQGLNLDDIAQALVIAAAAVARAGKERDEAQDEPALPAAAQKTSRNPPPGAPLHSIAAQWASLEARIFVAATPPTQRKEMRRAFYAGGQALFSLMMDALDPGSEETEDDMARMDGWAKELRDFGEKIKAGDA
jgi:hypothetical protein